MAALTSQQRSELRALRQAIDDARLSAHARVRVYRNVLIVTIVLLSAGLILFPLLMPALASDLAVIRQPSTATAPQLPAGTASATTARSGSGARADLTTVEVWGVVGGLIGALVALRTLQASRRPIGLQLAQLMLKLPAGAVTAVFGVVLLQSDILPPLKPVQSSQLAAYAILFGFAQEAVTGMVDRQAARLLNEAKSISDKTSET